MSCAAFMCSAIRALRPSGASECVGEFDEELLAYVIEDKCRVLSAKHRRSTDAGMMCPSMHLVRAEALILIKRRLARTTRGVTRRSARVAAGEGRDPAVCPGYFRGAECS